jgi:hypothetical protein
MGPKHPQGAAAEAAAQQVQADAVNAGHGVNRGLAPDPGVVGHTWSEDGGLMVTVWYVDEEEASYTDHVSVLVADHGCDILDDYLRATPDARNIKILGHRVDFRGTR